MHRAALLHLTCSCLLLFLAGCTSREEPVSADGSEPLFVSLPPGRTGIDFTNVLSEQPTPHRNELLFEYFSNGAGVAVGDLNGDGLDDLYFVANMTYNRLYLNEGDLSFKDVTNEAGVAGRRDTWKTGVAMGDVNGDGLLDIYVSYSGDLPLERRIDELYVNQGPDADGIPIFEEQAAAYGLVNPHSSSQAYFLDYDRDGDLDLFLLTHNVKPISRQDSEVTRQELEEVDPVSGVRLYENLGGRFEDVTSNSGIRSSPLTYGLGAGISDLNGDGWMDIYVGNDYSPPDYLYLNKGDGTFSNEIENQIRHISRASMGVDVADIDNDGHPDILVLDMLPPDNRRQKLLFIPSDRDAFEEDVRLGFHYQYMRNTLQLNNGNGTFSEIGRLAGVSSTDWSWSPLIADYDNDGYKDIYITNGMLHDITHIDFLLFKQKYSADRNYDLTPGDVAYLMDMMPSTTVNNYAFKNLGNLRFEDVSSTWGLGEGSISTGAAYADLDNDGDLDLIVNNINASARILENVSTDVSGRAFLQIELEGTGQNRLGIGSKITAYAGGRMHVVEQMPTRGYLSSVSPVLHVGLGRMDAVDSLVVDWPDGRRQTLTDVAANQRLVVRQDEAEEAKTVSRPTQPLLTEVPSPLDFEHRMPEGIDDFRRQHLLPNSKSFVGPPLARADVDGDGLADVFVGGGSGQAGRLFLQRPGGSFEWLPQPAFEVDAEREDADAVFLDANDDGLPDLYVASGGYGAFAPDDPDLQDRLYLNDGNGRFTAQEQALPSMRTSTGAVAATDLDGDGSTDLFVGGYVVPGRYPETPRSYLLINDGDGRFEDRTADLAPQLERIGMVSDAAWNDLNGDGAAELVVVGAWMPITVFSHRGGRLIDSTAEYFDRAYTGLWNTIQIGDWNDDGHPDLLAGNLGFNSLLEAGPDRPAELHYADFNRDGMPDPILSLSVQERSYPFVSRDELIDQMAFMSSRFPSYTAYADAALEDIFTDMELDRAQRLEATHLATSLFLGTDGGTFEWKELPVQAQLAPVFAVHASDIDGDGRDDLLLVGNMNEARIRLGKYDANYGVLLRGDGQGGFRYVPQRQSGLSLKGDVRSILVIGDTLLFGVNRRPMRAYRAK